MIRSAGILKAGELRGNLMGMAFLKPFRTSEGPDQVAKWQLELQSPCVQLFLQGGLGCCRDHPLARTVTAKARGMAMQRAIRRGRVVAAVGNVMG
jgi:hypothetical protein